MPANGIEFSGELLQYHIDKINNVVRKSYEELGRCLEMIDSAGRRGYSVQYWQVSDIVK